MESWQYGYVYYVHPHLKDLAGSNMLKVAMLAASEQTNFADDTAKAFKAGWDDHKENLQRELAKLVIANNNDQWPGW